MNRPSDAERQVRHGVLYSVPMVVSVALPMITLPIFTRALTTADYGALAMATAYAVFASGLANLGLPLTYERNFFEYQEKGSAARLLYSVVLFVATLSIAIAFVTWFFRESLSLTLTGSRANGALLLASFCAVGLQSVKLYFLTYFKNVGDAKSFVRYSVDETILWTAISLVLVAGLKIGPIGLPLGQLVGSGVIVVLLAARFVRTVPPSVDRTLMAEAVRLSLPLTPRLFIAVVSNNFDKYIVGALTTIGGAGLYSIGQKLAQVVFGVMTSIQNVYAPAVYRRMFAGGTEADEIGQYLSPFAYVSVGIALVVAVFAEEALYFLTPPEYHGASLIVNLLAVSYAVMFFGKQPQLMFAKRPGLVSALSAVSVVLYVGITWLFVKAWGALGAAWGTLAATVVSTAIGVVVGQRHFRINFEWGRLAAMYGVLVVAAVVVFTLDLIQMSYSVRFVVKLVAIVAFVVLGHRLGYLDRNALSTVRRAFSRRTALPTPASEPAQPQSVV